MQLPKIAEYYGIRILTTSQLAEMYGTDTKTISYNFSYNKKKYLEGKHYIKLEGAELRAFKASREIPDCHKFSAHLYLWTEKGALLHAKSLNTDKAWEVYDYLVDFYFRAKEPEKKEIVPTKQSTRPVQEMIEDGKEKTPEVFLKGMRVARGAVVDIPENKEAQKLIMEARKYITALDALLDTYSMYRSEDEFKKIAYAVMAIGGKISRTTLFLYDVKPGVVEKCL
ncbi:toxin-antitoxin system, toxin component, Bro family [Marvinbryantia formatexigens DSM 14469]|uniref:Toxin-antitoxin system, toxin component, Bro family n=2 Tax=Marvinbryantia TaxID=248744 RepID=C6LG84_9FIRM|nr:toxin-antitoxin system, toxin component, Bro family [Marvinbryantia formatexigens DSM 14469]SDH05741.1 ORF6N domain-containing protein [Marvinbryantia formatexigens]